MVQKQFRSMLTEYDRKVETRCETLETEAKDKFKETTSEVETRVSEVRKKLGLDADDTDQRIDELSAKIDALTEAVAKLAANK